MNKVLSMCMLCCYCLLSCSQQTIPPIRLPSVITTRPTVQDVPLYQDYPGHIEAYNSIDITTQIAGELTGMYFEEGTEVNAGQLLFTIDSRPYRAALEGAEAALEQSVAALRFAEETASRYSRLVQDEYVAKLKYDQYLTNVLIEKGSVAARRAELENAKLNLGYTTIYSPLGGIAGKKQIDVGNYLTVAQNPPLVTINQINPVYASFYVPDIDLPAIQKYQRQSPLRAQVFLNADETNPFEGKLTLIDNGVRQSTASIFMKATLCNEDRKLWPGEFVTVRLILTTIKQALLIPSQCLQVGPSFHFVFKVKEDQTVTIQKVKAGQRHGDMTLIEEGIDKDDLIVSEGQLNLYEGAKVVQDKGDNFPSATSNDAVSMITREE